MSFSMKKSLIIARREYFTTVRRKAFVLSLLLTPTILFVSGFLSTKLSSDDARARLAQTRIVAVVDSSGLYQNAELSYEYLPPVETPLDPREAAKPVARPRPVPVILRRYESQAVALDSL